MRQWVAAFVGAVLAAMPLHAQAPDPVAAPAAPGVVAGHVTDATTGAPVPFADIRIEIARRAQLATAQGTFALTGIDPGIHLLRISRIGYASWSDSVVVASGDTTWVVASLQQAAGVVPKVEVTARREADDPFSGQKPVVLSGRDLRQNLSTSVGSTLADQPGIAERTMGPAAARPVVRGLSGNRLVVLEDGQTTGDLSATSDDHAVVIDPIHAQEIEVIRGPAALVYGTAVLGGVVNVKRGAAPAERPSHVQGTATLYGESVNRGGALQARVDAPAGRFGVAFDVSGRSAGDVQTPGGPLDNTGFSTWNGSAGATYFGKWGTASVSGSLYDTDYGIPGGFVGGHASGVDIQLDRRQLQARVVTKAGPVGIEAIETEASYSHYYHEELEAKDVCGISFGLLTSDVACRARFDSGRWGRGVFGIGGEIRDYANGCFSFIVPTVERALFAFAYDQLALRHYDLQFALRFDHRSVEPEYETHNKAGWVRPRSFGGLSGALGADVRLGASGRVGATAGVSFRPPALEELYTEGPHLAAYAYEIGNTELDAEHGLGFELHAERKSRHVAMRAAVFHNILDGFIQTFDTGEYEYGQGELGFLARYQYRGVDATMTGGEVEFAWRSLLPRWEVFAASSWVRGEIAANGEPLPRIPPLQARVGGAYTRGAWTLGLASNLAAAQDRLGAFEEPTAAYALLDARLEWNRAHGDHLHSIMLRLDNLTDAEYRNHISRIKSISPEAGRGIGLIYRVQFF